MVSRKMVHYLMLDDHISQEQMNFKIIDFSILQWQFAAFYEKDTANTECYRQAVKGITDNKNLLKKLLYRLLSHSRLPVLLEFTLH